MTCFYFSHIPVFKIRGERVVEERGTLPLRLLTSSVVPNLAATILPMGETVEDVPSTLSTPSTGHVPVATMSPVMGVGDDSGSFPPEVFTSSSADVYHEDKEKKSL
ncbi:hypothetical protein Adt_33505 [Abeliophyllum distichum]|uniref:Uncharacterized protein n=1 Tax=Abeliophyllum distichum TaxID=126358 RepID=A0ABD1QXD6_9LAMI